MSPSIKRSFIFGIVGICGLVLFQNFEPATAVNQTTPLGFASLDGGTSGGDPDELCHVKDYASLASCAKSARSQTLIFDVNKIEFSTSESAVEISSHKTIDGKTANGYVSIQSPGGIFRILGTHNIIIRNVNFSNVSGLIMDHPLHAGDVAQLCPDPSDPNFSNGDLLNGCGVPILINGFKADASNIWIDHNTFSKCGLKCIDAGNTASKNAQGKYYGANDITISNNVFKNSFYSIALTIAGTAIRGNLAENQSDCAKNIALFPQQRMTVYGNLFENVRRRSARAAYCTTQLHEFNNVIRYWGENGKCEGGAFGFGPSSTSGAQLFLENNVLIARPDAASCKQAVNIADKWEGYVRANGNLLKNGALDMSNQPENVFNPPYSYFLLPGDQVRDSVLANSGPQ